MRIDVYSVCWNEILMLPFFLRHYERFATRIVVYDEDSDDGTPNLLRRHPKVETRRFLRSDPRSLELSKQDLLNRCWQESRGKADWVILADIDEHVYHPDLVAYLSQQKTNGVTIVPALGFQMVTETFPCADEHLATARTLGEPSWLYNKPIVFDANSLQEIGLSAGAHESRPVGRLRLPPRDELMLLHYKFLGFDYVVERYRSLAARLGADDNALGMDLHFRRDAGEWWHHFKAAQGQSVNVAAPGFDPSTAHLTPPWRQRPMEENARGRTVLSPGPITRPSLRARIAMKLKRW